MELTLDPLGSVPLLDASFTASVSTTVATEPSFREHLRVAERRPSRETPADGAQELGPRDADPQDTATTDDQAVPAEGAATAAPPAPIQATPAVAVAATSVEVAATTSSDESTRQRVAATRRRGRGGVGVTEAESTAEDVEADATNRSQRLNGGRERKQAEKAHGGTRVSNELAAAATETEPQAATEGEAAPAEIARAVVAKSANGVRATAGADRSVKSLSARDEDPQRKRLGDAPTVEPATNNDPAKHTPTANGLTLEIGTSADKSTESGSMTTPEIAPRTKSDGGVRRRTTTSVVAMTATTAVVEPSTEPRGAFPVAGDTSASEWMEATNGTEESRAGKSEQPPVADQAVVAKPARADAAPLGDSLSRSRFALGLGRQSSTSPQGGGIEAEVDRVRFVQRVAKAFQHLGDQEGQVRLRLSPPSLGSLHLEVTLRGGELIARLQTETEAAKHLLLDNLSQLRERLAEQDIKIARFDVDLMGQPDDRGTGRQTFQDLTPRQALPPRRTATHEQDATTGTSSGGPRPRPATRQGSIDVLI